MLKNLLKIKSKMEYKGKLYAKVCGKYIECTETVEQLESRIKELESEKSTELITEKEDYYGAMTNITTTKCCGIGPITNENFCPNCGRKIVR